MKSSLILLLLFMFFIANPAYPIPYKDKWAFDNLTRDKHLKACKRIRGDVVKASETERQKNGFAIISIAKVSIIEYEASSYELYCKGEALFSDFDAVWIVYGMTYHGDNPIIAFWELAEWEKQNNQ